MKYKGKNPKLLGFTLIEVLVSIGILGILAPLGLVFSLDYYRTYILKQERDLVVSLLVRARGEAMDAINQSAYGIHFGPGQYVVFEGATYSPSEIKNQNIDAAVGVQSQTSHGDVVFSGFSGAANFSGNIILSSGTKHLTINLNNYGQINW